MNNETTLMCLNCGIENKATAKKCFSCGNVLIDYETSFGLKDNELEFDDSDYAQTHGPQRRPWSRYFARNIDYTLFGLVFSNLLNNVQITANWLAVSLMSSIVMIYLWIPLEALLLSSWGTTPGKWLFNIIIRTDSGDKLSYSQAFQRGFMVVRNGLAMGIPIISLINSWDAHDRLLEKGKTKWDAEGNFVVRHQSIGAKIILVIVILISPILRRFF